MAPAKPGRPWDRLGQTPGLNVTVLEPERLEDMRQAVAAGTFDDLLTKVSYIADQETNMEW